MVEERQLWLGRNGERSGPFSETTVRQWLADGTVAWSTLAWHEGMADWKPLSALFDAPVGAGAGAPPLPPTSAFAGFDRTVDRRAELPEPPSMHWALVLLLSIVTVGIFALVWRFIQATWVKKIDPSSKATPWLVISLVCTVVNWMFSLGFQVSMFRYGVSPGTNFGLLSFVGFALSVAALVFFYMAYFGMANSLRRALPTYGLIPDIGGVTLFFFTTFYLQGQMSWVARWKDTGETHPPAPKAIFWWLWLAIVIACIGIFVLIMAAFAAHMNP